MDISPRQSVRGAAISNHLNHEEDQREGSWWYGGFVLALDGPVNHGR